MAEKVIFYQGLKERLVWDASEGRVIIEFDPTTHSFETDDEKLIARLKKEGYPTHQDMMQLQITGQLDHGGFEKPIADEHVLPSKMPPVQPAPGDPPIKPNPGPTAPTIMADGPIPPSAGDKKPVTENVTVDGDVIRTRPAPEVKRVKPKTEKKSNKKTAPKKAAGKKGTKKTTKK